MESSLTQTSHPLIGQFQPRPTALVEHVPLSTAVVIDFNTLRAKSERRMHKIVEAAGPLKLLSSFAGGEPAQVKRSHYFQDALAEHPVQ